MKCFIATTQFQIQIGTTELDIAEDTLVDYDEDTGECVVDNQSYVCPRLGSAIKAGWLVDYDEYQKRTQESAEKTREALLDAMTKLDSKQLSQLLHYVRTLT